MALNPSYTTAECYRELARRAEAIIDFHRAILRAQSETASLTRHSVLLPQIDECREWIRDLRALENRELAEPRLFKEARHAAHT